MATNRVKFEVSLKELTFKFEGDRETAERVHDGMNKALDGIRTAQVTALSGAAALPPTASSPQVIDMPRVTPKKGRRSSAAASADGGAASVKASGAYQHLMRLRREGFFGSTPRLMGEILGKLKQDGYIFKSNDLSSPLLKMTRDKVLTRNQNAQQKQWEYTSGPVEPTEAEAQ